MVRAGAGAASFFTAPAKKGAPAPQHCLQMVGKGTGTVKGNWSKSPGCQTWIRPHPNLTSPRIYCKA